MDSSWGQGTCQDEPYVQRCVIAKPLVFTFCVAWVGSGAWYRTAPPLTQQPTSEERQRLQHIAEAQTEIYVEAPRHKPRQCNAARRCHAEHPTLGSAKWLPTDILPPPSLGRKRGRRLSIDLFFQGRLLYKVYFPTKKKEWRLPPPISPSGAWSPGGSRSIPGRRT